MQRQQQEGECLREARAELVSLGGAVMLGVCILMTCIAVGVWLQPGDASFQTILFFFLAAAAWIYLCDSCSERLCLTDGAVELTSLLSRGRHIPLADLESLTYMHDGFNLERGVASIEFRQRGRRPERIPLGPCWQQRKLETFLQSVEAAH